MSLMIVGTCALPATAARRGKGDNTQGGAKRTARSADSASTARQPRSSSGNPAMFKLTPDEARSQVALATVTLFNEGSLTQKSLTQLITQGSAGELPAAASTREAFVAATINALFGVKLTDDEVKKFGRAVAVFADADELSPSETGAARIELDAALTSAKVSAERSQKVLIAFDQSLAEQLSETRRALRNDLVAAQQASELTAELVDKIKTDLAALAAGGAKKPQDAALQSLATNLADVMHDGSLTTREKAQLVHSLAEAMSRDDLDDSEARLAMSTVRSSIEASNVSKAAVQKVVGDVEAIRTQVQPLAQRQLPATTQPSAAVSVP